MNSPQKCEAPGPTGDNANQHTTPKIIGAAQKIGNAEQVARLKAAAALRGITVLTINNGTRFITTKWGYTATHDDLEALKVWLQKAGVAA